MTEPSDVEAQAIAALKAKTRAAWLEWKAGGNWRTYDAATRAAWADYFRTATA